MSIEFVLVDQIMLKKEVLKARITKLLESGLRKP